MRLPREQGLQGLSASFFYTPYGEEFKNTNLQNLELPNSSNPKPSKFQKDFFSYSAPFTKHRQTDLEKVPFTKAMGANNKTSDNHKPPLVPPGALRILLLYSVRQKSLRKQIFKSLGF